MKSEKKRSILLPASLASVALLIVFLPNLLSTEVGNRLLLSTVNRFSKGTVEASSISLSWLGNQEVANLHYNDSFQGLTVTCEKIVEGSGLLSLLFSHKDFKSMEIVRPKIVIASNRLSAASFERELLGASFLPEIGSIRKDFIGYKGQIKLTEGSLEVSIPGSPNLLLSPIEAEISLQGEDLPSSISLHINTLEGDVKGNLDVQGSLSSDLSLQASCTQFPLKGVDQMLGVFAPRYKNTLVPLLGPSLNMTCFAKISDTSLDAGLKIAAKNLQTDLQIQSKDGAVVLTAPASLALTVTQQGNEKIRTLFPEVPLMPGNSSFSARINFQTLSVPVEETRLAYEKASFTASFACDPYAVKPSVTATVEGTLSTEALGKVIVANITSDVGDGKNTARTAVTVSCEAPLSESPSFHATLTAQKTPTSLIDGFLASPVSPLLGSWIEGSCAMNGTVNDAKLSLRLTTPLLSLPNTSFHLKNKELTLDAPVTVSYRPDPTVIASLTDKNEVVLREIPVATLTVSKASLSNNPSCNLEIAVPGLFFTKLYTLQNYPLPPFTVRLDVDTLAKIGLQIKSPVFLCNSTWAISGQKLTLIDPLKAEYTIQKQDVRIEGVTLSLQDMAKATVTCAPGSVSLEQDLSKIKIGAKLEVTPLHMQNTSKGKEITVEHLACDLNFSGAKDLLDFSFGANLASVDSLRNDVKGSGSVRQILARKDLSFVTADVKIDSLSLTLLQEFYPFSIPLVQLLGHTVTSSIRVEKTPDLQSFSLDVTSPLLKAKGDVALQGNRFFFPKRSNPFTFEYTLTPEGYKALLPVKRPFVLSENTVFTGKITDLEIPCMPGTFVPDLTGTKIAASLSNPKAVFQKKDAKELLTVSNAQISLKKETGQKDLTLSVDAGAGASSLAPGNLHLDVVLAKFLDEKGVFTLASLQTTVNAEAKRFPSSALDVVLALKKEAFVLLLGPSFDATLNLSLQNGSGPVGFTLSSANAHLTCIGNLNGGVLRLEKDLTADLLLTPELGKFLLKQSNASSVKSLYASSPITLKIASKGFSVPIQTGNVSQVQIPSMRIDIGKIYCRNEGAMASLLKQLKSRESEGKEIQIWLAPMDLHVNQGVIDVERTEILLDKSYDIALWGGINLPNDFVDMTLGLTADALRKAFGIKQLPDDYILTIPIKGPLNDVQVKTGVATSKITTLLLWQSKALDSLGGGLGGLLKQVIPPPGGGKAPPPKRPFPWETGR